MVYFYLCYKPLIEYIDLVFELLKLLCSEYDFHFDLDFMNAEAQSRTPNELDALRIYGNYNCSWQQCKMGIHHTHTYRPIKIAKSAMFSSFPLALFSLHLNSFILLFVEENAIYSFNEKRRKGKENNINGEADFISLENCTLIVG